MNMFSTPKMPTIKPPTPLPDDEATTAARRRTVAREVKTGGAMSTNYSAGSRETLGG
jgi:hypothetical protein